MSGEERETTRAHVRGSSLLLAGQGISIAANLAVQVVIVRYLTKEAFGAFGLALSVVNLAQPLATLGLDRTLGRFVSIYDERGERARLLGAIALVMSTTLSLGLAMTLLVFGLQAGLEATLLSDRQAVSLLTILIVLAPVQALDTAFMGLFAAFGNTRAVFLRRHVLAPLLRLAVVGLLVLQDAGVVFLAYGYLTAGVVGVAAYGAQFAALLRRRGLLAEFRPRALDVPVRTMLAYSLPLLTSELVYAVLNASDSLMLGHYRDAAAVASLRAVQPAARLNQLVMTTFTVLFTPMASRLFARGDRGGINRLYWDSAAWIAVLSFPIFALTFVFAAPVTVLFFGERYATSAPLLSVLAFGYYFQSALGFNGLTLKICGRVREIVVVNLFAVVANLALNAALIPRFGAMGAAAGTAMALVVHNILKQVALWRTSGVALFERSEAPLYGRVLGATALLLAVQVLLAPAFVAGIILAAVVSLTLLAASRHSLHIADTFPELARVPVLGRLAAGDPGRREP